MLSWVAVGSPYGATSSIAGFGVKPVRGAHRTCAPEPQDTEVLWLGEGPKPEKRKKLLCAIRGVLLFGDFLLDKQEKVTRPRFGNRNYNFLHRSGADRRST